MAEMFRKLQQDDSPRPSTKVSTLGAAANAENRQTDSKTLIGQLRGDLDAIVLKATEKDRARRYGTASELAADVLHYLRYEPVSAHAPALTYRVGKYVRRHRVGVSAAAAVVALLAISAMAQNIQLRRVTRERDRADRITRFMTQMFNVAAPRQARGRNVTAREVLDNASQDIEKTLGSDPELKAQMMDIMGQVYSQIGVYPRAEALLRDSSAIRRRVLGQESPDTLRSLSDLGGVLFLEGHYHDSENVLSHVVEAAAFRGSGTNACSALTIPTHWN